MEDFRVFTFGSEDSHFTVVEVDDGVLIHESTLSTRTVLPVPMDAWQAFIREVRSGNIPQSWLQKQGEMNESTETGRHHRFGSGDAGTSSL